MSAAPVLLDAAPFEDADKSRSWIERGIWPASWIGHCQATQTPLVCAYKRAFTLSQAATVRVHVSADERYDLFLDGERIGRGSERSDIANWHFETYDLGLEAGNHLLVARVWSLGLCGPRAQMSVRHGFLLAPDDAVWNAELATGEADWQTKILGGTRFLEPTVARFLSIGHNVEIEGAQFSWDFQNGAGEGWQSAQTLHPALGKRHRNRYLPVHGLTPATLPPQMSRKIEEIAVRLVEATPNLETRAIPLHSRADLPVEHANWQALLDGGASISIPPHTARRVLLSLSTYFCAFPSLTVSGGAGAQIRISWAESLFDEAETESKKGQRDGIEGKFFRGTSDVFRPEGGPNRRFETLWWSAGRFLEIALQTGAQALEIGAFTLSETRYPLETESVFRCSDAPIESLAPLALRSLQMCCHETYMDGPYYEQVMWAGDSRLQMLTSYALSRDERLPRKAISLFGASQLPSGFTRARYPTRDTMLIPGYCLWWAAMVCDFAWWRGDKGFIRNQLPGVRAVLDAFNALRNAEGLIEAPPGWNYADWVKSWPSGIPPDGEWGVSGLLNWQYALVLGRTAELEAWCGEPEIASLSRRRAGEIAAELQRHFWDEKRGVFADDRAQTRFSEHTQSLAIFSGLLPPKQCERIGQTLGAPNDLSQTTLYFSHYLFEALAQIGRGDVLMQRLELWLDFQKRGFVTTPEAPEPTRSDCHGWGAHPLFHFFASILGIRPASLGFESVRIAPQLGHLSWARGEMVHPRGVIEANFQRENGVLRGEICLPRGLSGTFVWGQTEVPLRGGAQVVEAIEANH